MKLNTQSTHENDANELEETASDKTYGETAKKLQLNTEYLVSVQEKIESFKRLWCSDLCPTSQLSSLVTILRFKIVIFNFGKKPKLNKIKLFKMSFCATIVRQPFYLIT